MKCLILFGGALTLSSFNYKFVNHVSVLFVDTSQWKVWKIVPKKLKKKFLNYSFFTEFIPQI